ncbi:hypothetical protein LCGC14_1641390 [marine sediment metagenome]|uniref:Uncharacterized protein n=1 Tax=marine sediment metagenome TaxID=412755 RepID=A0A0F9KZ53_9ZZZZ
MARKRKINACESCGQDTAKRRRCKWCAKLNCTHCSRSDLGIRRKCRSCY